MIVIPVRNRQVAENQLVGMLEKHAARTGQTREKLSVILDAENQFYAYPFPYPSLPSLWLGYPFRSVRAHFIGFWQNNRIMTSSGEAMASYMHKMTSGETLYGNMDYQ